MSSVWTALESFLLILFVISDFAESTEKNREKLSSDEDDEWFKMDN